MIERSTPLKRSPMRRTVRTRPGWAQARQQRLDYADGWCETVIPDVCTGIAVHVHHRRRRGQGGTDQQANLLAVCAACHNWIHTHVAAAEKAGWLLRSGADE